MNNSHRKGSENDAALSCSASATLFFVYHDQLIVFFIHRAASEISWLKCPEIAKIRSFYNKKFRKIKKNREMRNKLGCEILSTTYTVPFIKLTKETNENKFSASSVDTYSH
jgi:hypothetical protein